MRPVGFPEANLVLTAPGGINARCENLPVHRGLTPEGDAIVISAWEPTPAELAEIQRTGRVWLLVWGQTAPPVAVTGERPFVNVIEVEPAPTPKRPDDRVRRPR